MSLIGKADLLGGGRIYHSTIGDRSSYRAKSKGRASKDRKRRAYAALRESVLLGEDGRVVACAARCGARAESVHHLLGGSRRANVLENLVPLCGDGTRGCHGVYTTHHRLGTGRTWLDVATAIRETLEEQYPDRIAYLVAEVNETGLDRLYPKGDSRC